MKRILASGVLGVVLASSVLAKPASAQIQVILGGNERHDWREQQLERDRQHRLELERDRQRKLEIERERQRRLEIERERQRRFEEQRRHRDRF
ncbi:hypothetical protein NIES37_34430 [Tolypothrix tenuis PCC 7101]|uniref:Uncharacterized protein n=1 Tax=Tolypothrix tenuis PCC 7101 TaxID=231146 RepID=A0A1Z4N197_9CYAN|nr:hypothetical protein [Aulosira sp. FACHB-113]BAY99460.1 hypothetical protein NIES37_34430 [Tolypothrix tenuis PCC 7101]BAZ76619.1 hypothetical protein NIES50_52170 [Aulosira laxa NIES-50]